jgi:hypothetical protein
MLCKSVGSQVQLGNQKKNVFDRGGCMKNRRLQLVALSLLIFMGLLPSRSQVALGNDILVKAEL